MNTPPKVVRYQGHTYRLREGATPEPAQQRLQQVEDALGALERNGYPINLPPKMKRRWTINSSDILKSIDTMDGSPMLLMWNPMTSELLMSSNLDVNAPYHSILHSQYRNEVQKYPFSDYGDWVRGMYDDSSNKVTIYKWEPLDKYMIRMSPEERKKAKELQVRAVKEFGKMLSAQGAGGDVSTTEQFIPR